jgi:hypothetical protein
MIRYFVLKNVFYHFKLKATGKIVVNSKVKVSCTYCNNTFLKYSSAIKRTKNHLCSIECRQLWLAQKRKDKTEFIIKHCQNCNEEIRRTKSHFKNRPAKKYFCSTKCKDENLKKGRGGFTPIIIECSHCNLNFTITKKGQRKRKYCSKECMQLGFPKGENHNNFKPELSRDYRSKHRLFTEVQVWRTEVFQRDLYTCQLCNKKGDRLNAHHFENYSANKEKRFDIDNGITLCVKCHKSFHKKYGVVRNNKKQFEEFKISCNI